MSSHPDIIVIGAGIVGCSAAYELARRGAAVEILEERTIGMGATQASAGMLAPYNEAHEDGPLFDLTVRSLGLYDDFVTRVMWDSGASVRYQRHGTLEVATDAVAMTALRDTTAHLIGLGIGVDLLDADAARGEEPELTPDVVGGLLIAAHGCVSASELTRATCCAARRHGARLVEGTHVTRVARRLGGVAVDTAVGTRHAAAVVLAAGVWSGAIEVEAVERRVVVNPVRGQLLQLAWDGPRLRRILWSSRCYLVPWDDGTVLVGATTEQAGFDEGTTVAGVRALIDAACAVTPRAIAAGFSTARAGLRPATADGLPIIGHSSVVPGLMYATGHYRNGVLLAPLTAQLVADAILDQRIDTALAAVSPSRFGAL